MCSVADLQQALRGPRGQQASKAHQNPQSRGAGAGSPRPHRPRPGHAGRGTLAARSGGRAAGGGTAPGTKRPSQRWKAAPPGDALPPPPQRATPARKGAHCGAVKVLPWVIDGAGGLGAGKTSGAGTRGVDLNVAIGGRTGDSDTNGGESSNNGSKIHVECYPAENPSL